MQLLTIQQIKWSIYLGIEVEFFLRKKNRIYNASRVLEKRLGFSIDQNKYEAGSISFNNSSSGIGSYLRTDGTACELQVLAGSWYADTFLSKGIDYSSKFNLIRDFDLCFVPFVEHGGPSPCGDKDKKAVLVERGTVYSSGKTLRNAYDKTITDNDKKEANENGDLVKFRTAGIHIHFSISRNNNLGKDVVDKINHILFYRNDYTHTDEIVKGLDDIYYRLHKLTPQEQYREDNYQKRGDYRLKFGTATGSPTLEYRQLASGTTCLKEFIQQATTYFAEYVLKLQERIVK